MLEQSAEAVQRLGQTTFDKITLPTPTQQRAFELIGVSIPLALK